MRPIGNLKQTEGIVGIPTKALDIKPGKRHNDKIMLNKLINELKPMQQNTDHLIRPLSRTDFYQMLLDLKMLLGPTPSKRDNQDAQEFLNILFEYENEATFDHAEDISQVQ